MKIGLYFGSFNPIHIGHLIIANTVYNFSDVDQIWFVISPKNPLKKANTLLNEYDRLFLVQTAVENNNNFRVSDIEFKLPRPSYTIDTITYLKEIYPQHHFSIIIGSDSYKNIDKWKNGDLLLKTNRLIIYIRPGFEIEHHRGNISILEAPLLEISSTMIRDLIKKRKSARYLLPEKVFDEIEKNGYYR